MMVALPAEAVANSAVAVFAGLVAVELVRVMLVSVQSGVNASLYVSRLVAEPSIRRPSGNPAEPYWNRGVPAEAVCTYPSEPMNVPVDARANDSLESSTPLMKSSVSVDPSPILFVSSMLLPTPREIGRCIRPSVLLTVRPRECRTCRWRCSWSPCTARSTTGIQPCRSERRPIAGW